MRIYIGLTDDPIGRREEHGNPGDWQQTKFASEAEARAWKAAYVGQPGFHIGLGESGWRYGYWYTITDRTTQ